MNCVLTTEQQKQLFKKVFVDLLNNKEESFDVNKYLEDFYDAIVNKAGDKALALTYISMVPQYLNVNIGVNKDLRFRYVSKMMDFVNLERQFSDINNVESYINERKVAEAGIQNLESEMQDQSLRAENNENTTEETTENTPVYEPIVGLTDMTFENERSGEMTISADKKLYANIKRQLIQNANADGTSSIQGIGPVKLQFVSTQLLETKDLYPDTQRDLQSGDQQKIDRINKSNQEGVVLMVTDPEGGIIYFDDNGTKVEKENGKPVYFLFRNPQPIVDGKFKLSDLDKQAISQIEKSLGITKEEAEKAYLNKIGAYKNIRAYINKNPKTNRLDANLTGGWVGVPAQPNISLKTPLKELNMNGTAFYPQRGMEEKGQHVQSYYFELPNIPTPIQVKKPEVPKEFAEKLASLLFDDISIVQRGNKIPLAAKERIRLFEQFFFTSPITISLTVDENGQIVMKRFGSRVKGTPEEQKAVLVDYMTRLQPNKELKKSYVGTRKIITDLSEAKSNYVLKTNKGGVERYFLIQPAQLEINENNRKNNVYDEFNIENVDGNLVLTTQEKPYTEFIKNNFYINYPLDASGNIQTVNAVLNFDLPVTSIKKIKEASSQPQAVEISSTPAPSSITDTDLNSEEVVQNADLMSKINEILKNQEFIKLSDDGKNYVNTKTGKKYQRVTSFISDEEIESNALLESSTTIGTKVDNAVRDFFAGNLKSFEQYDLIDDKKIFDKFIDQLQEVQKSFAERGETVLANDIILYNDELGLAGTVDLLTYDKAGNVRIYDMKTMRGNNFTGKYYGDTTNKYESAKYGKSKKMKHQEQLSLYRILMNNTHGVTAKTLGVMPIEVAYAAGDVKTLTLNLLKGVPLTPLNEVKTAKLLSPTKVETKTEEVKPKKLSAKELLAQQRKKNPDIFNKIIAQKGLAATEKQIQEAMDWYTNHPLSKSFPFESMFNVINLNNPNSIATWQVNGITLYKGSDFSDLYHEAWHGFTQGFMTREQKEKLYKETRTKSGSFVDYNGNRVKFADATELQLEEFLAEDFREYMLSGGTKVMKEAPVRNTIFRKILNFLKALFGNATYNQTLIDNQVNSTIKDLYEKLRLGNLSEFSFAVENRNFNTLNKAAQAINKMDAPSLSFEDSRFLVSSINSLFSEYADLNNAFSENDSTDAPLTYKFTTKLFETPEGLAMTYEYVKARLIELYEEQKVSYVETPSTATKKNMDLLKWTIRNFGNTEDILKNSPESGVIGYHLANSEFIPSEIKEDLIEDEENDGRELEGKNYYDRGGNEQSIFELGHREIINIIKALPKYDVNDKQVLNSLGLPELNPFKETFAHIAKTVQNLSTPQKMRAALEKEIANYPTIKHLLEKLGPVSYEGQSSTEVDNWTRFWQTFNLYRIPLIQTTVDEISGPDDAKPTYEIRIGNALAGFKRVGDRWENAFKQNDTNPFIKNTVEGNFLDAAAILEKYPTKESLQDKQFEFLRDIGIGLKDTKTMRAELKREISSGSIKVTGIYDNIKTLHENGMQIGSINRMVRRDDKLSIAGEAGADGNYGKLQKLQYRFADEDSDFMVINAAGDPVSEFSQNTTLTQILKFVNEAESYSKLISIPAMSFLNKREGESGIAYNPAVEASIWIKSLFNMNEPEGPKYPGAKIELVNLSGLTKAIDGKHLNEGSISTELDEYSKLIMDFHSQLMSGVPELTRHAGKKTSLSAYLNFYKTYAGKETSHLYIDTEDFAIGFGDTTKGYVKGIQLVMPYITSELKRINYAKYLLKEGGLKEYDFDALNRMTKFVKFAGILSEKSQEGLLAIKGDVDGYMNSPESVALRDQIETDIIKYFNKLAKGVERKMSEAEYISPTLMASVKAKLEKKEQKQWAYDTNVRNALINSFVWNNWIHHVEETIMFYGDVALYKGSQDFFKRNTGLNSTGKVLRNDEEFRSHINKNIGRPIAKKLGVDPSVLTYNGILNAGINSDVELPSQYLDLYQKELAEAVIDKAYGTVNEADAAALISLDTYRIINIALGDWTTELEDLYQKELNGEPIKDIKKFFGVKKMGYYGPTATQYLPLQALHKFALFPLIPSVIKGTNLEKLHEKMMKEGVDYVTFKSGSKISTIAKPKVDDKGTVVGNKLNPFYSDLKSRTLSEEPFVKNPVYVEYMKDQVATSYKFKGKVSFFSQLRKLIDTGLMENGKPVDPSKLAKRQAFIDALADLQTYKRKELLAEIGWKLDENGLPTGDMKSLLELVSRELKRRDFPEHTWQFIQTMKDGNAKHSLDISQFAEEIEKMVVALVNKRLVKFKVNGEQLVQVASTGFENLAFAYGEGRNFEKPTAEDLKKYGSNDLPTYHKNPDGSTAAAKVKIALQGNFKNLLKLQEVIDKAKELKISNLQALNMLLKDEAWLNTGENRKLITMVGARIPTQGLNSMEFVEIYEFLPTQAGSIIIAPTEITAKSGTDYDYDKLPMMMPHIRIVNGKAEYARAYTKDEAKAIYDLLVKAELNKTDFKGRGISEIRNDRNKARFEKVESELIKLWGDDYLSELEEIVKDSKGLSSFNDFFNNLNGSAVLENRIIEAARDILSDPINFTNLIRPNSTEKIEPVAKEEIAPLVTDPELTGKSYSTEIFEPMKNLQIHQSNTIGKRTLGIVAKENPMKTVFNGIGMHLNPFYTKGQGKTKYRATLLFPHNKAGETISLSQLKDAAQEHNIADVISQLMNGTVDVEKDDWVSFIQMNEEAGPIILFMVMAGVPIKDVIYFVSQPLIRKYVTEQRLYKSSFANALGKKAANPKATRIAARNSILGDPAYNFQIGEKLSDTNIYKQTLRETENVSEFKSKDLYDNLKKYAELRKEGKYFQPTDLDRQTFLHYLEIENIVNAMRNLKGGTDVDTTTPNSLFEMREKMETTVKASDDNLYPASMIDKIRTESAIGPFFIQEFAKGIFEKLFPMRNGEKLNNYVANLLTDEQYKDTLGDLFKDDETLVKTFKNDFISYIFQNHVRNFKLENQEGYKDYGLKIVETDSLPFGAVVKDGILVVDKAAIKNQFEFALFTNEKKGDGLLAGISENAFRNLDEYTHFILERETLRSMYNMSSLEKDFDYKHLLKKNWNKTNLRKEGQTDEEFQEMIKKISYEEWLRNKALYNTLNPWVMFKSGASIANKFVNMIEAYPELRDKYSLTKLLQFDEGRQGYRNLRIAGDKIDGATAEILHENLKNLANNSVEKVSDPIDNKYISDFFGNFSVWMFMQAGLNPSPFSFSKVIDQDAIARLLEKPYKDTLENLTPEYLDKFTRIFVEQNLNRGARLRSKNFLPTSQSTSTSVPQNFDGDYNGYTNYSGGAQGSDTVWEEVAKEFGVGKQVNYRPEVLQKLTPTQMEEVENAYQKAAKDLGRKTLAANTYAGGLVRRDYLQAKAADAVFAISTIIEPGQKDKKGYVNKTNRQIVEGGTGYAVQMGINLGKPVFVFDQLKNSWFTWDGSKFVQTDAPILTKKFAGIGTREINDAGRQAIKSIFSKQNDLQNNISGNVSAGKESIIQTISGYIQTSQGSGSETVSTNSEQTPKKIVISNEELTDLLSQCYR